MLQQLSILSTFVLSVACLAGGIAHAMLGANTPLALLIGATVALLVGVCGVLLRLEEVMDLGPVQVAGTAFACAGAAYIPYMLSWNVLFVLSCLAIVGWVEWRNGRTFFGTMLAASPVIGTLFGRGLWAVDRYNARHRWYGPPV